MITYNYEDYIADGITYREGSCLSTDTKPVEGVENGSKLLEMDTGKLYMFDKANEEWKVWG